MAALAKDTTVQAVLGGLTGTPPERTAKVVNIDFDESQFEAGQIDTSNGNNKTGSGFLRTADYISIPQGKWKIQLFAAKPWLVYILYYDSSKQYANDYDLTYTGYCNIKNYPYCRLYFYGQTSYLSNADFIANYLKIQYITNAPAANEYFLHNHLFNGNFEFDRNSDGIADGWALKNSPTSSSVSDKTQTVTPAAANYFIQMDSDNRLTGHKIYVAFTAYTPHDYAILGLYGSTVLINQNNTYTRTSAVLTATNSASSPRISCASNAVGHPIAIRNVMMIDLTEIYGAGNEPTAKQVDAIVDTWYGGYVPCEYVAKYDDSSLPVDVLSRLRNIDNGLSASDSITMNNGAVSTVEHYVGGELQSTISITRDNFGNIVAIEEG